MSNIKVSTPLLQDLKTHKYCELQLVDNPFGDGLVLRCLDHNMDITEITK